MNIVALAGNLGRDPKAELFGEHLKVTFSIALNRKYRKGNDVVEETDWVDVVAWGGTAEFIQKYLTAGAGIIVSQGELRTDVWTKKGTDEKRSKTYVLARRVEFPPSRGGKGKPAQEAPADHEEATDSDAP